MNDQQFGNSGDEEVPPVTNTPPWIVTPPSGPPPWLISAPSQYTAPPWPEAPASDQPAWIVSETTPSSPGPVAGGNQTNGGNES